MKKWVFVAAIFAVILVSGMVFVACNNVASGNEGTGGSADIVVTIKGIPSQYIGLESEIKVNPTANTFFGPTIFEGTIENTTMTVSYNLTQEDINIMKNLGTPYNPNGSYWVEFDIEESPYNEFLTKTSAKFNNGKITLDFSDFKDKA
jgi:hypothetical protein